MSMAVKRQKIKKSVVSRVAVNDQKQTGNGYESYYAMRLGQR